MVLENLFIVVEMISALYILSYLNDKPFAFNIKNICLLTTDIICLVAINEFQFPVFLTGIVYVLFFLYTGFEYGFQIRKMIINMILMIMIVCACQAIAMSGVIALRKDGTLTQETYLVINVAVLLVATVGLRNWNIYRISKVLQEQDWIVFFSLLGVGTLLMVYIYSFKTSKVLNVTEYVIFFMGILYVCFMTAMWKYYKNVALEKTIEMKTTQIYSSAYKNMIEDVRAKQHDFDNHLSAIVSQHYICNDYDSLVERQKDYISMVSKNNKYNRLLWSGESVIVGFLYGKCLEAEKKEIEVDYHLRVSDFDCAIPDYQLIRIIGNLFDNAVEAVGEMDKRIIRFLMEEREDGIHLEIANPCMNIDRNEIAKLFKRKYSKKGENRGYGLYNVKKLCDQHGIALSCDTGVEEEVSWMRFQAFIKK